MTRSMTGFGQGQAEAAGAVFKVEIRSVNSRYRELKFKLPRLLTPLEEKIKEIISQEVTRGRVEILVRIEGRLAGQKLAVNTQLAADYVASLRKLGEELSLAGEPDLSLVAGFHDIINLSEEEADLEAIWPALSQACEQAVGELAAMRTSEGERLKKDILARIETIAAYKEAVAEASPKIVQAAAAKLQERVTALVGDEVDPQRLAQEAALLADRMDITEEIVRLGSHIKQFHDFIKKGGAMGRKLDFLVQELNRELNTIGSKANDADISHQVVEAKAEMEKIREQVQNIE